jgi:nifR3 family TIM-barrel protein
MNFWHKLPKPFFILAPMANVTDAAFRRIIAKYGRPDVFYTEFVSADGLCSIGKDNLLIDLKYSSAERPIVAQLFGSNPEKMREAAALIQELGFDGLDINMGCPDKNVMKQKAGAALIKQPDVARALIRAAKAGAPKLPISVKTRLGDTKNDLGNWLPVLLEEKPAAIIIHARTRKEMSKVPAHWDAVKQAVDLARGSGVLIIGNGDVSDLDDAREKIKQSGCDGVMLGRAIFGNPWLFKKKVPAVKDKLKVMLEHTKLFDKLLGKSKSFHIMRKHYKAYANGFDGAKDLRIKLMTTENVSDVETIVKNYAKHLH